MGCWLLILLWTLGLARADLVEVQAGTLAAVGDELGGAEVERIQQHPEFERLALRLPDGGLLLVEITAQRGDASGACAHHGRIVQPRWELLDPERAEKDQPEAVLALCSRLEDRGADWPAPAPRADPQPTQPSPDPRPARHIDAVHEVGGPRPLQAVLLGLLATLIATLLGPLRRAWRSRPAHCIADLGAVAGLSLLARLVASPRVLFLGPDAGYERLVLAWGRGSAHPLYGDGYASLMAGPVALFGPRPEVVFWTDLGLAVLAPPLLWATARMLPGIGRWGALVAGVALALNQGHLWLSGTEVMHVSLLSLQLLAAAAAVGFGRSAAPSLALLSALAAGFAAHIRPEGLSFLPIPPLLALAAAAPGTWRQPKPLLGAALGLACLGALGLTRIAALPPMKLSGGPVRPAAMLQPDFIREVLSPGWGATEGAWASVQLFVQGDHTPLMLPVLAALGIAAGLGRGPRLSLLALLAWWACTGLLVFTKSWPLADGLRLQLPSLAAALLLAGLGAELLLATPLHRWLNSRAPALLMGALTVGSLPRLLPLAAPWASHAEFAWMVQSTPNVPDGALVLIADDGAHTDKVAQVIQTLGRDQKLRAMGMTAYLDQPEPASPLLAWQGVLCAEPFGAGSYPGRPSTGRRPCRELAERCTLKPAWVTRAPGRGDADLQLPEDGLDVGYYSVSECRSGGGQGAQEPPAH